MKDLSLKILCKSINSISLFIKGIFMTNLCSLLQTRLIYEEHVEYNSIIQRMISIVKFIILSI